MGDCSKFHPKNQRKFYMMTQSLNNKLNKINNLILKSPLLVTTGDPAGIGMDILAELVAKSKNPLPVVACGCLRSFAQRIKKLGYNVSLQAIDASDLGRLQGEQGVLFVLDTPVVRPVVAGISDPANAPMVADQLTLAHNLASGGQVAGIVTAPLAKSVMIEGGIKSGDTPFLGHTEFFMHACGLKKVVMMLTNEMMRVALVTTHLPLRQVASAITSDSVFDTISIVHNAFGRYFAVSKPKILVCGLNPHAGEAGHLGREEIEIINPTLRQLKAQGVDVSEAMPADTLFTPKHLADCDVVVAMYHDQGLAPLKSHGFGETVNVTLGLPYIRTSVDHGTAMDLAGTGRASSASLAAAILLAGQMATA